MAAKNIYLALGFGRALNMTGSLSPKKKLITHDVIGIWFFSGVVWNDFLKSVVMDVVDNSASEDAASDSICRAEEGMGNLLVAGKLTALFKGGCSQSVAEWTTWA